MSMNQGLLAPDIVSVAFWVVLSPRWQRFIPESMPRVSIRADRLGVSAFVYYEKGLLVIYDYKDHSACLKVDK